MDPLFLTEKVSTIIQIVTLIVLVVLSSRLIGKGKLILPTFFFTFSIVSGLLNGLYWFTFDVMRPGERMPIAANEISECALFLLLSASVASLKINCEKLYLKEVIPALIILVCNAALWVVWSGEWLEDIFSCIVMGVLFSTVVRRVKQTNLLPVYGWCLFYGVGALAIVLQTITIIKGGQIGKITDISTYFLIIPMCIWFDILTLRGIIKKRKNTFLLSIMGVMWAYLSLYMSPGYVYYAVLLLVNFGWVLMYLSLKNMHGEVYRDDLR